jgi:hypothetical protein
MDPHWFDRLAKLLARAGTRRGLLGRLAPLPLAGLLAALRTEASEAAGRRKRRVKRHKHQVGDHKDHRKGKRKGKDKASCAKAGQTPKTGKHKGCCAGLSTDASGRCAAAAPAPGPAPACTGLNPTNTSATQGLQETIDQAQPGATLTLCAGTWTLTSTILIPANLTLIGAGAGKTILDGGNTVRVLAIASDVDVTLQDLTITNGSSGLGAGIFNLGTLTLVGVSVTMNTAFEGGGISNISGGTVTLATGSSVSGNTAVIRGGGIYNNSGGMLTLQAGSTVSGNTAPGGNGGGIDNFLGTVTLEASNLVCGNTLDNNCAGAVSGTFPANCCPS